MLCLTLCGQSDKHLPSSMENTEHENLVHTGSIFRSTQRQDNFGSVVACGTVSSTVCLVDTSGNVNLSERRYPAAQDGWHETFTTFKIEE
jgi:hypothetical protein